MPQELFPIERNNPARIKITWDGGKLLVEKNIRIFFDHKELAYFPERAALEQGQEFNLDDGNILKIILTSNSYQVYYNGQDANEIREEKIFSIFLYSSGGLTMLMGASYIFNATGSFWLPVIMIGIGILFILLGIFLQKNTIKNSLFSIIPMSILVILLRVVDSQITNEPFFSLSDMHYVYFSIFLILAFLILKKQESNKP